MLKANAPTVAAISVLVSAGVIACILISLTAALLVANNQRENSVAACERGNIAREAITTTASVIQSNLIAASRADRDTHAVSTYAANIEKLAEIKHENQAIDCDSVIPEPSLIP